MEQNYYEILEVNKNASPEIIEKAYKTLVKKYHPDLQKDEDKNKNIPQIKTLFTVKVGENLNLYLEYPEDNSQYVIDYYYFIDEVGNKVEIKQGKVVNCPDISDLVIYIELKMQWTKNY